MLVKYSYLSEGELLPMYSERGWAIGWKSITDFRIVERNNVEGKSPMALHVSSWTECGIEVLHQRWEGCLCVSFVLLLALVDYKTACWWLLLRPLSSPNLSVHRQLNSLKQGAVFCLQYWNTFMHSGKHYAQWLVSSQFFSKRLKHSHWLTSCRCCTLSELLYFKH